MLFIIGSLFGLRIGATLTNKSFSTKNSLLQKTLEKWEAQKAKKTGILWIRHTKKTACRLHLKIMIVLNNYRQTTSCFFKPLKVSFAYFWISSWINNFSSLWQSPHRYIGICVPEIWYPPYFYTGHWHLWANEDPDSNQTNSEQTSKWIRFSNVKKVKFVIQILWVWMTDSWIWLF